MHADVFDLITFPPLKIKGYVEDFEWGPFARIYVGEEGDVIDGAIEHRGREGGRSTRTLVRSTFERAAFVGYFALRRALLGAGVIATTLPEEARCESR